MRITDFGYFYNIYTVEWNIVRVFALSDICHQPNRKKIPYITKGFFNIENCDCDCKLIILAEKTKTMKLRLLPTLFILTSYCITSAQDGTPDITFGTNGVTIADVNPLNQQFVSSLIVNDDNKIFTCGYTGGAVNGFDTFFTRFNADGSIDTSFGNNGSVIFDYNNYSQFANATLLQADGKIIVAGTIHNHPENPSSQSLMVFRINGDGTLDSTFGNEGMFISELYSYFDAVTLALDSNNNIIIGANRYSPLNGMILKLNPEGTTIQLLNTISPLTSSSDSSLVNTIRVLADDRILVAGYRKINSTGTGQDMVVMRLNADGSTDTTFGTNGYSYVHNPNGNISDDAAVSIVFMPNNKILIGGLSIPNPTTAPYVRTYLLAQFDSDGTPDMTYGIDGKAYWNLLPEYSLGINYYPIVQPDGKIIFSGQKRLIADNSSDGLIVRFNSDGTLDENFGINGQFIIDTNNQEVISSIVMLANGKIIGAGFGQGAGSNIHVLRLLNDVGLDTESQNKPVITLYPNPVSKVLYLNPLPAFDEHYKIADLNGRIVANGFFGNQGIAVETLAEGIYFLLTESYNPIKFIKQ
ncbi:hypothetical protein HYN48_14835 [Flavobacterium magnum]|uniref:Secretion system C-terminal sorting domain-containing protein n=1 Tax=Flavobacterium magnum TaxID=2162713 RepID=A0A2S0RHX3_9FLAO|nr:T9SS type A sorting domain-containing protein [Flavobacterium magnum]AWA31266.1 hypothetical protein HYN48_14835 [Flavobacterium magnum]